MIVMSLKISIVYDDDISSFFDGFDVLIRTTKSSNMRAIQQENSSMNGNGSENENGIDFDYSNAENVDDDVDDDVSYVDDDDGDDDVYEIFSSSSFSCVSLWTM